MPCARRSSASRTMREITAFTYGQWLQMKATTRPFGPFRSKIDQVLPSTAGSRASTAFQPKSQTGGMAAMRASLVSDDSDDVAECRVGSVAQRLDARPVLAVRAAFEDGR